MTPETKVCSKCGEEKLLEAFRRHPHGRFGREAKCKECLPPASKDAAAARKRKERARKARRRPEPVTPPDPDPSWRQHAACRGKDPDWWFPPGSDQSGSREPTMTPDNRKALRICNGEPGVEPCPVRERCLAYALSVGPSLSGIFGGTSQVQRRRMRRKRLAS